MVNNSYGNNRDDVLSLSSNLIPASHEEFQAFLATIDRRKFRIKRIDHYGTVEATTSWTATRLHRRGLWRTMVRDQTSILVAKKIGECFTILGMSCPSYANLLTE